MFLDSDDELLPDALARMYHWAHTANTNVGRLGFMYQLDNGTLSPNPPPVERVLDYVAYLRWSDKAKQSDLCLCVRKTTFKTVPFPTERAYERIYHLSFSRQFKTQFIPEIVGLVHGDAANRAANLHLLRLAEQLIREAPSEAANTAAILCTHGLSMRDHAPKLYRRLSRCYARQLYLAGDKRKGTLAAWQNLKQDPFSARAWLTLCIGLLWPMGLACIQAIGILRRN